MIGLPFTIAAALADVEDEQEADGESWEPCRTTRRIQIVRTW